MKRLVMLRHGESVWNKENRFTGWTNVDLSEKGVEEAHKAGQLLRTEGFRFAKAYTSYLKRAIKTLNVVLDEMDLDWIPVEKTWILNEKHYGALQGLNKAEMAEKYGDEQVHIWRRSYDVPPLALDRDDKRAPLADPRYAAVDPKLLPLTESLKDTVERITPFWENVILPDLAKNNEIIIAAHGNSLRSLVQYLDSLSEEEILKLNIPTGVPLVYELDADLKPIKHYYLGDQEAIAAAINSVANQGKKQ